MEEIQLGILANPHSSSPKKKSIWTMINIGDAVDRKVFKFHFVEKCNFHNIDFYATRHESGDVAFFVNTDKDRAVSMQMMSSYDAFYVAQFIDSLAEIYDNGIGVAKLWGGPEEDYDLRISLEILKFGGAKILWENIRVHSECQSFSIYLESVIDSEFMLQDILGFVEDLKSLIA